MKKLIIALALLAPIATQAATRVYICGDYSVKITNHSVHIPGIGMATDGASILRDGDPLALTGVAYEENAEIADDKGSVAENYMFDSTTFFPTYRLADVMNSDTPAGIISPSLGFKQAPVSLIVEHSATDTKNIKCKLTKGGW